MRAVSLAFSAVVATLLLSSCCCIGGIDGDEPLNIWDRGGIPHNEGGGGDV